VTFQHCLSMAVQINNVVVHIFIMKIVVMEMIVVTQALQWKVFLQAMNTAKIRNQTDENIHFQSQFFTD